jgi:phospholipase A1
LGDKANCRFPYIRGHIYNLRSFMKKTIISFLFLLVCGMAHSQVLAKGPEESYNADSIRAILDKSPYFTLFKDNYFIGGIPIGEKLRR